MVFEWDPRKATSNWNKHGVSFADLSRLKDGVRGKYFSRATAGTNLVLIDPDLSPLFPDSESVNRALRVIADAAKAAASKKRRTRSRP